MCTNPDLRQLVALLSEALLVADRLEHSLLSARIDDALILAAKVEQLEGQCSRHH